MGAGNFGSNSTIKIASGGVVGTSSSFSTGANQYALVSFSSPGLGSISVGVITLTCLANTTCSAYVGPSSTVTTASNTDLTYVIFSNSP